jgi:tetratricopeptide (TPR) repeat protein
MEMRPEPTGADAWHDYPQGVPMKRMLSFVAMCLIGSVSMADNHETEALDYGDFTSVTLMVKSWETLGEGNFAAAVKYTEKCAEIYEDRAREMQASMSAKADADEVNEYWALNDVGTCYFIRGEALTKLRRYEEALAAYKVVRDELYYAQAWDPKGWYWSPADAAYPKIAMLEARLEGDF